MPTKHEQILQYIKKLEIGNKISVRQVARFMKVSEGTAYRAIKEAEAQGLVQSIERVGTVRVQQTNRSNIEQLTFAEVVNIVDGHVLGGSAGLHKTLQRFVIGAMKLEAMMRYVESNSLLIVGNRDQAHLMSLKHGAAVLVTGGFDTTKEVKELADRFALPVISTSYDTFTVASLINRAIYDRMIKKEILLVEDIYARNQEPISLEIDHTISDFHEKVRTTGHARYPVLDKHKKVVGIITAKDVIDIQSDTLIEKVMTRQPITISPMSTLASAAHEMAWEGIELLPVVDDHKHLLGVLSRQDVIKSLQHMQKQPQIEETIQEACFEGFEEISLNRQKLLFQGSVTPQMVDHLGNLSVGILTSLMTEAGIRLLRRKQLGESSVQSFSLYLLKPIQLESKISIIPHILDAGRKQGKLEIEVLKEHQVMAKALLTAHIIEH
ncbi:Predicted transcriptional regulator containing CBS domains [Seinonella peptonophila]|uniref:Predicted transcriptional regulator containing CBS domains n=1 Tax=Seinonella peptonophila TaxID=112248 RepID=A0A1M4W4R7_9BACL|nr:DRTGG domain-containing protein [Seinonella peptonophila]SHE76145.1 Predicted transcriptional regulator containing CBS domains [Seinonella peptonophila]